MKTLTRRKLLQEIEAIKSTMTDVDLFGSVEFADYLKSALKTATQGVPREITLLVSCEPQSNETACTSGEKVYINTLGPLIRPFETRYGKYAMERVFQHCSGFIWRKGGRHPNLGSLF